MAVDLEQIKNLYHVIPAQGAKDPAAYASLRELDNEIALGVKVLWDDDEETIVAYLLGKGTFSEDAAQAWVDELQAEAINLTRGFSLEDTDLYDIVSILSIVDWTEFETADGKLIYPWLKEVYTEYVICVASGHWYKIPFTLDEENNVTFDTPIEVKKQYVPLSLTQAAPPPPNKAHAYRMHIGKDPLPASIASGPDGLIWKEIFQASTTYRPYDDTPLVVEQWEIDAVYESFGKAFPLVPITAKDHWDYEWGLVPVDQTIGKVKRLVKVGGRLWAGLDIKDPAIRQKLDDDLIADCSVFVWFDFNDNRTGQKWDAALVHLLLTNFPQLPDLAPFGVEPSVLAADLGGVRYTVYQEVSPMTKQTQPAAPEPNSAAPVLQGATLSAEDLALLEQAKSAGFSMEAWQQVKSQQAALQTKLREAEVNAIVAALEGRGKREDVAQVEGYRHYPAVIKAAVDALQSQPQALSLSIGEGGETGLDKIVLSIVNALPAEARIALDPPARPSRAGDESEQQPAQQQFTNKPTLAPGEKPTDEQLDKLNQEIGG